MAGKLFGNHIEPACEYCEHGQKTKDGQMILCKRNGVVAPYFSCWKFLYAPLKRMPKSVQALPQYTAEDFKI